MGKYYFTFGVGQPNEGKCIEVLADDDNAAREKMIDRYGTKWAFQYTEEEYLKYRADGTLNEVLLTEIVS